MPRIRLRGHRQGAPVGSIRYWHEYFLTELRARRLPLEMPRRNTRALLGFSSAKAAYESERIAADGEGYWLRDQEALAKLGIRTPEIAWPPARETATKPEGKIQ
jgi:hypothetical protein